MHDLVRLLQAARTATTVEDRLAALEVVITEIRPLVLMAVRTIIPGFHDAEDVLQNALVRIAENADTFHGDSDGSFRGWAWIVGRNCALKFLESRKSRPRLDLVDPFRLADVEEDIRAGCDSGQEAERILEMLEVLDSPMAGGPQGRSVIHTTAGSCGVTLLIDEPATESSRMELCKELLIARYVREMPVRVIAQMYKTGTDAMRMRISRCLQRVRGWILKRGKFPK